MLKYFGIKAYDDFQMVQPSVCMDQASVHIQRGEEGDKGNMVAIRESG